MLTLYNTLTRRKEVFEPFDARNVRVYVCGPTVYDSAHIGNARPAVVFDVLFRLLRKLYGEECVCYVRNITDVDDKINARAAKEFPDLALNEAIARVTEKTARQYDSDMKILGCLAPTHEPRATDYILPDPSRKCDMVSMINVLLAKGHAYSATGDKGREILFRVRSMGDAKNGAKSGAKGAKKGNSDLPEYGALSNRSLGEQQAGARIAVEAHKEDAEDFVLWKESSESEPGWEARFADETVRGRPGWHIECSAMSAALLGETFDIHGGGHDLIFPHHENEIAQSCAAHGTGLMAKIWMHNGFLRVNGQKMSKSQGNFINVRDLTESERIGGRKWSGDIVRLALLMGAYREPLDFTPARLGEADSLLKKWRRQTADMEPAQMEEAQIGEEALAALCDDLDISAFLALIGKGGAAGIASGLSLLGFDAGRKQADFDPEPDIKRRLELIGKKDWSAADRIRDDLLARGILLKDGKDEQTGCRITSWEAI